MIRKVALAAGGTGGHLFPALALAEEIFSQLDKPKVVFFAADRPLDRQVLAGPERTWDKMFRVVFLPGRGFGGQPLWKKGLSMVDMSRAVMSAWWRLRGCDALVAFGGYASVPAVIAAGLRRIPVYLHEQNAVPGRANRLLARRARKIFLTFEDARERFGRRASRCVVTGGPIRRKIIVEREAASRGRMRMLVVGGSQGARFFVDFFAGRPDFFAWLLERVDVLFLAGSALAQTPPARRLVENARDLRGSFTLLPFLERMGPAVRSADIVISRAGSSFLAELVSVGKARTILVPYPHALDDHQTANARAIAAGPKSLADVQVIPETESDRIEAALHEYVVAGPVPPPQTFPDVHAGSANRIIENLILDRSSS